MRPSLALVGAAALLAGGSPLPAGDARAEEPSYPAYQGYVTDTASLLQPEERARIEALSGELERKTTAQLAVATVATTAPLPIDEYAVALFTRWGIGQAKQDNGVLLLVARDDRAVWIETGYGLEGAIPDATAHRIVRDAILPAFRAGDFGGGILKACGELAGIVAAESGVTLDSPGAVPAERAARGVRRGFPVGALVTLLFIFLVLGRRGGFLWLLLFGLPRGGRYGGGGFGGFGGFGGGAGGGFGGFGGGATGGGGAGGRW